MLANICSGTNLILIIVYLLLVPAVFLSVCVIVCECLSVIGSNYEKGERRERRRKKGENKRSDRFCFGCKQHRTFSALISLTNQTFLYFLSICFRPINLRGPLPTSAKLLANTLTQLKQSNSTPPNTTSQHYFVITYRKEGSKTFELKAESESECNAWVHAIENAR